MKPNFALIFSAGGICLLYRTFSGWARVGGVPFDTPDLDSALANLRASASHLPGDRTCKLVIPGDQIKYLTVETSGDPDQAVRTALEGATPYKVDQLEYDWTAEGGTISVAAVALETLAEAEDFAVQHGFESVSFAAIPGKASFRGEPFFGVTEWAGSALPEGTTVERDDTQIQITGAAQAPAPSDDGRDMDASPDPVAAAATRAVAEAGPAPKHETRLDNDAGADHKAGTENDADAALGAAPKQDVQASATSEAAPASLPVSEATQNGKSPPKVTPPPSVATAFTSIRASRRNDGAGAPPVAGPSRQSQLGGADKSTDSATASSPAMSSLPSPASDDVTNPVRIAELAASLQPNPQQRLDHDAEAAGARDPDGAAGKMRDRTPGLFTRRDPRPAKAPKPAKAKGPSHEDEKQRMTVFGARQSAVRGKPRFLGLILTAILLLFLVGVAAWASVFLDDGLARFFRGGGDIKLADVPAMNEAADESSTEPDAASNTIAPLPSDDAPRIAALPRDAAPDLNVGGTDASSVGTASSVTGRDVTALPDRPSSLAPSEAMASYAATGIWQMAPAPPEIPGAGAPVDDIYRVSIDPSVTFAPPASLPRSLPDARDIRPEKPTDPPPAGMRFDFDARGLVRATPQGAMTPEGVRIVAGSPALTPPANMAQTVSVTVGTIDIGAGATTAQDIQPQVFTGDPALAGVRPRVRPQTALPSGTGSEATSPDAPQQDGENLLAPSEDATRIANAAGAAAFTGNSSLAALRPRLRPASAVNGAILQSASGAAVTPLIAGTALTLASAAAQADNSSTDAEVLDDAAFESATPQAVTASLTPLRRPKDFETTVERTREQIASTPEPTSQRMQPKLPSSASVAKQATDKNVLNLREVNLIGVYGSSASRRALVRLGNGHYQKVRVGDTLDGGQVAAIGDGELRYVKRGRNVLLRMPQG